MTRTLLLVLVTELLGRGLCLSEWQEWPGEQKVWEADEADAFDENLSGVYYQAAANSSDINDDTVWAVKNKPSTLFRMKFNEKNKLWEPVNGEGTQLLYPDGQGDPDTEDITMADPALPNLYVCTEQNNDDKVSRLSVLLFRVDENERVMSSELTALQEWDLTEDLKSVDHNLGLEAITWVPDAYLVAHGFRDESRGGELYDPSNYPNHGSGIFFVGLEDNGKIYAYALIHGDDLLLNRNSSFASLSTSSFTRISAFSSEFSTIMALHFDYFSSSPPAGYLWAVCDNNCGGHSVVYSLVGDKEGGHGEFEAIGKFNRPDDMSNINNEGFTTFSESQCDQSSSLKGALWSDDSDTDKHSLRQGTVFCGDFITL